jgi:hypothetical protein
MIFDLWTEKPETKQAKLFRVSKNTCKVSNIYVVQLWIFHVSLEILKPKKELNHERSKQSS